MQMNSMNSFSMPSNAMSTALPKTPVSSKIVNVGLDPNRLIKIFVVTAPEKYDYINKILSGYTSQLNAGEGNLSPSNIYAGMMVLVHVNPHYRRAYIEKVEATGKVIVKFIDYGESATVTLSELRNIGVVQHFSEMNLPPLAVEYILNLVCASSHWEPSHQNFVSQLVVNQPHTIRPAASIAGKSIVDFFVKPIGSKIVEPENLAEILVNHGLASYISLEYMRSLLESKYNQPLPPQVPTMAMPMSTTPTPVSLPATTTVPQFQSMMQQAPPGYHRPIPSIQNYNSMPPQYTQIPQIPYTLTTPINPKPMFQVNAQYHMETLTPDVQYPIVVSNVVQGMQCFTVQLKKSIEEVLTTMMISINDPNNPPIPFSGPLQPGTVCLARNPIDGIICRAVVSGVVAQGTNLYFVDFGNTEVVQYSDIFQIPVQFMAPKTMALHFALAGCDSPALQTEEANSTFAKIVKGSDNLILLVTKGDVPSKQYCELFVESSNGKHTNIKTLILDNMKKTAPPAEYINLSLKQNSTADIIVSYIDSPARFFVQVELNQAILDAIMRNVERHCCEGISREILYAEDVNDNMPVCAQYSEDERWYRGLVLENPDSEGKVCIYFVDYGNQELIHFSKLHMVNNDIITSFPKQAMECHLDIGEDLAMRDDVIEYFSELADGNSFRMKVLNILPSSLLVDLFDADGNTVKNLLMEKFGVATTPSSATPEKSKYPANEQGKWRDRSDTNSRQESSNTFAAFKKPEERNEMYNGSADQKRSFGQRRFEREGNYQSNNDGGRRNDRFEDNGGRSFAENRERGGETRSNYGGGGPRFQKENNAWNGHTKNDDDWRGKQRDRNNEWNNNNDGEGRNWAKNDRNNNWNNNNGGEDKGWAKNDRNNNWNNNNSGEDKGWAKNDRNNNWNNNNGGEDKGWAKNDRSNNWNSNNGGEDRGWAKNDRSNNWNSNNGGEDKGWAKNDRNDNWNNNDGGGEHKNWSKRNDRNNDWKDNNAGESAWGKTNDQNSDWNNNAGGKSNDRYNNEKWGGKRDSDERRGGGGFNRGERRGGEGGYQRREQSNFSNFEADSYDNTPSLQPAYEKGAQYVEPEYEAGHEIEVNVSWFIDPHHFYAIPQNDEFRAMMEKVQEDYPNRECVDLNTLSPNESIVARDTESVIYRARFLSSKQGGALVSFVDYGNSETVKKDEAWTVSSEHCIIPIQAIRCKLHNVTAVDENTPWSQSGLDEYFSADSYTLKLIEKCGSDLNIWSVQLISKESGKDVGESLIAAGLASSTIKLKSDDLYDVNLLQQQTITSFIPTVISSNKFFIHVEPEKAQKLNNEIADYLQTPDNLIPIPKENLSVGEFCLVNAGDECYYRAVIERVDESSQLVHVLYIDYGDEIDVSYDKVLILPDHVAIYPPLCMECCIHEGNDIDEKAFTETVFEKDYIVKVVDVIDGKLHVILYNVNDGQRASFCKFRDESVSPVNNLPIFKTDDSFIITHVTADKVYLQRVSDGVYLEDMSQKLTEFYDSQESLKCELQLDKLYAAKSEVFDGWYRCRVTDESKDTVFYIDYGNSEKVEELLVVKELHEDFYSNPRQCIGVSTSVKFSTDDLQHVIDAVGETTFKSKFKYIDGVQWYVELACELSGKTWPEFVAEVGCEHEIILPESEEVETSSAFAAWNINEEFDNLRVAHIETPECFFLQTAEDANKIATLQEKLQHSMKSIPPIVGPYDEKMVAQNPSDGLWYRVSKINEKEMLAYDFGFTLTQPKLKKLPTFLDGVCNNITRVSLNVQPLNEEGEWEKETTGRFIELVADKNIRAKLEFEKCDLKFVELIDNDTKISKVLMDENRATLKSHQVTLSHANALDDFYIQFAENENKIIELADQMENAAQWEDAEVTVGALVAGQFVVDEQWYRASIVKIEDEAICVKFVDYGNESVVTKVKQLPEQVKLTPSYAVRCSVSPLPEKALELNDAFSQYPVSKEGTFSIRILDCTTDVTFVRLEYNGKIIDDVLEADGKILPAELNKTVIVKYINTPSSFYVENENAPSEEIEKLLIDIESTDPLTAFNVGDFVAAEFPEDGVWYRAKIIDVVNEKPKVLFIDFGNECIVEELRALPDNAFSIPQSVKHCAFALPSGFSEWPEIADTRFKELTGEGSVVLNIIIKEEGDPAIVDLTENGEMLAEELLILCKAEELTTPQEFATKEAAILSYVNSFNTVWVQIQTPQVDEMYNEMSNVDTFDVIQELKVGDLVAAKFIDDEQWYRAKIVDTTDEGSANVIFIDFGNESVCEEFKMLPDDLANLLPLAKQYKLKNIEGGDDEWAASVYAQLQQYNEQSAEFDIVEVDEDSKSVSLKLREDGVYLSEKLLALKQDTRSKDSDVVDDSTVVKGTTIDEELCIDSAAVPSTPVEKPESRDVSNNSTDEVNDETVDELSDGLRNMEIEERLNEDYVKLENVEQCSSDEIVIVSDDTVKVDYEVENDDEIDEKKEIEKHDDDNTQMECTENSSSEVANEDEKMEIIDKSEKSSDVNENVEIMNKVSEDNLKEEEIEIPVEVIEEDEIVNKYNCDTVNVEHEETSVNEAINEEEVIERSDDDTDKNVDCENGIVENLDENTEMYIKEESREEENMEKYGDGVEEKVVITATPEVVSENDTTIVEEKIHLIAEEVDISCIGQSENSGISEKPIIETLNCSELSCNSTGDYLSTEVAEKNTMKVEDGVEVSPSASSGSIIELTNLRDDNLENDSFKVTFTDGPGNIYVSRLQDCEISLNISDILRTESLVEEKTPKVGQLIGANLQNRWSRAKIVEVDDINELIKVMRVDFGDVHTTKVVYKLPESLAEIPPLAYHCILKNHNDAFWQNDDVVEKFVDVFTLIDPDVKIKIYDNKVDITINDVDIVQVLTMDRDETTGLEEHD